MLNTTLLYTNEDLVYAKYHTLVHKWIPRVWKIPHSCTQMNTSCMEDIPLLYTNEYLVYGRYPTLVHKWIPRVWKISHSCTQMNVSCMKNTTPFIHKRQLATASIEHLLVARPPWAKIVRLYSIFPFFPVSISTYSYMTIIVSHFYIHNLECTERIYNISFIYIKHKDLK